MFEILEHQCFYDQEGLLELVYSGGSFDDINFIESNETKLYNEFCSMYDIEPLIQADIREPQERAKRWFIPDEYNDIDLNEFFHLKCTTQQQHDRVTLELRYFQKHQLEPILKYILYWVQLMTENNIIWGLGRGSSCACYLLYLIGLNLVDPIKYNIDITEFIKE